MVLTKTSLDHLVIDVGEQIDRAESLYRALGFSLTPRGRHTLGSVNHLAIFPGAYLELLGSGDGSVPPRPDLAGFPQGLNGLVFQSGDASVLHARLLDQRIAALPPQSFSRPTPTPEGPRDARFDVVRLQLGASPVGRIYFCRHLTPELVWRPEAMQHPNSATGIRRILIVTPDPAALSRELEPFLAAAAESTGDLPAWQRHPPVQLHLCRLEDIDPQLRATLPEPHGRITYMAALTFSVTSVEQARLVLRAGGLPLVFADSSRLRLAPSDGFNVTLDFEEEQMPSEKSCT